MYRVVQLSCDIFCPSVRKIWQAGAEWLAATTPQKLEHSGIDFHIYVNCKIKYSEIHKTISNLIAAEQECEPVLLPGLHQGPPQGAQGPPKDQGLKVGLWMPCLS